MMTRQNNREAESTAEVPVLRWTREDCIKAVQDFKHRHGYQPVTKEAGRHNGLPSWNTAARLFGSWNALISEAGMRPYPARSSAQAKTMAHRDRRAAS